MDQTVVCGTGGLTNVHVTLVVMSDQHRGLFGGWHSVYRKC